MAKQEAELAATENAEEFRQKGELLTTFLHQVPNDQDQVTLDNYYTNQPITIALDKALTPSQNAQRYFKRYQKLKEAVKHLTSLIQETKETISYLETVETALAQASLLKSPRFEKSWSKQALSNDATEKRSTNAKNQRSI